jgi:succinate dehydrogenase / fumarate reductase, membrane anchor subunit
VKAVASGVRAWLLQRFTAVYMLVFLAFALACFVVDPPSSFEAWRRWVGADTMRIAIVVFFAALLLHAWVGLRDVVMDYVHPLAIRISVLALVAAGLAALAVWVVLVLIAL